ncbi:putative pre-mRNA-splicing factor Cwf23p [[Candida] railenensis]|uniref:Pre-mRNA-splicing factor Cwf23p n=1 Tax=[Candida] railenensis TaxID=45579 RepID=A0A9P0QTY0_9ASCO|nr:putative pre-mRNA-splicing factor Cwf23p [[Candida] railenensis]
MVELSDIINGQIDIYSFLSLEQGSSELEIKRSYRKKALEYHPDKNPSEDAKAKFHLLSQIYEILTNDRLRGEYDRIRQLKLDKEANYQKLNAETRRFREELERAEQEHRFNTTGVFESSSSDFARRNEIERKAELLKEEGLKMRRMKEQQKMTAHSQTKNQGRDSTVDPYKSYKDLESPPIQVKLSDADGVGKVESSRGEYSSSSPTRVIVKWKFKPELKGLISADVLAQIMSIFGSVLSVSIIASTKKNPRYDSAAVDFEKFEDALKATRHNYKESARLWDGTSVRKLSSLLRECVFEETKGNADPSTTFIPEQEMSYLADRLEKSKHAYLKRELKEIESGKGSEDEPLRRVLKRLSESN